ncbi:MAG: hypothetical protein LBK94_03595 [Prevotellaceae bacterium]|jgi:hypothetical protein|nr:hypothetical protein [Prevotellaceae bacterium]
MLSTKSNKIKRKLYKKAYIIGCNLVFCAGFFTWGSRPAVFYPQEKGTLVDIYDTISRQPIFAPRLSKIKYKNVPVYLFAINNNIYRIEHSGKTNKMDFFKKLKNKEIYLRYEIVRFAFYRSPEYEYFAYNKFANKFEWNFNREKRKKIRELIYNGDVIYLDEHLSMFFISLAVLILSLIWVIWAFIKYFKKPSIRRRLKQDEEEYFFENCKIMKSGNKYLLYYVSPLDNRTIKAIEITEEEFLSAKNGKMKLENFSNSYNLW